MGPLPAADRKVPLDVRVIAEEKLDGYVRKKLTFAAEEGDRVPAYLLVPTGFAGKRPAMLCLHQTVAIGKGEPVGLGTGRQQALRAGPGEARLRLPRPRLPELRRLQVRLPEGPARRRAP